MTHSVAGARSADVGDIPGGNTANGGRALVIAVDGPSGSGKSSAAAGAASRLGLRYLDTGATYRAVTWWLLTHGVDLADPLLVAERGVGLAVQVSTDPGEQRCHIEGIDVTAQIRERQVSNVVSLVASVPQIRQYLIAMQRQVIADAVASAGGIVAEGRDIGTVVAPDATVKVFLTASEQVRAERRAAELSGRPAGTALPPTADLTRAEQAQRDRRDAPQTQAAADAVEIDATELNLAEVIERIVALAAARRAGE